MIYFDEIAKALGISEKEVRQSIKRLVRQGWLIDLGEGWYKLSAPGGA